MSIHKALAATEIHILYAFSFASAAAREGATGLVAADVGKVAWQTDDNSFWVLTDESPVTWVSLGGSGGFASSIAIKNQCRVASTANIASLSTLLTLDGVTVAAGDRVLVKDQTTLSENGIYVAAVGAWTRASDFDSTAEVKGGVLVVVSEGTTQFDSIWTLATNDPITVGVTGLVFTTGTVTLTTAAPADVTKAAAVVGVAITAARADHKHDISTAAAAESIDIGDTAAEGSASSLARSDHRHAFPAPSSGYPVNVENSESDGTATTSARSDHQHKLGIGTTKGDVLAHDGTTFQRLPVGVDSFVLTADTAEASGVKWNAPSAADWPIGTVRFFMLSPTGLDTNVGFADGAPDAAKAVKTIAKLKTLIPRFGNGRSVVIVIEAGDYSTEDLEFTDYHAYRLFLVRGTVTDPTGASVAFANDLADKIVDGYVRAPSTETLGYRVDGAPTVTLFSCVKNVDGTPPGLPVEPALLGMRVRFDALTPTVALRNVTTTIWKNTTTAITDSNDFPAVPVAGGPGVGDVFYIERPGVDVDQLVVDGMITRTRLGTSPTPIAIPPIFSGINAKAVTTPIIIQGNVRIDLVGVHAAGATALPFTAQYVPNLRMVGTYTDEAGVTISVGNGGRIVATASTITASLTNVGGLFQRTAFVGGSGVFAAGGAGRAFNLSTGNVIVGGRLAASGAGNLFSIGNAGGTTARRLRFTANTAGVDLDLTDANHFKVFGVENDTLPAGIGPIRLNGNFPSVDLDDVVMSAAGSGFGLNMNCRHARVNMGTTTAITITTPTGQEIISGTGGGGPVFRFADVQDRHITVRDDLGNVFTRHQTTDINTAPEIGLTLSATAYPLYAQFRVVRRVTGAADGEFGVAKADAASTSDRILGVLMTDTLVSPRGRIATHGPAVLEFDADPGTAPALVYLSHLDDGSIAGLGRITPPPSNGLNQKLRLGHLLRRLTTIAPFLGVVDLHPELIPITSDGATP